MADADTKIADLKTDPKPGESPKDPGPEKMHPLDGVVGAVREAPDARSAVAALVEKLGDEFASPELHDRSGAIIDAVLAKVQSADAPFRAPAPATEDDVAALEARNHAAPHNEAAAAAVDAGMDTKTANEMTKVGSNI